MTFFLKLFDKILYKFFDRFVGAMPDTFVKIIAYYHPNPYLRKKYWHKLGVIMGENTLANLGLTVVRKSGISVVIADNVSIAPNVTFICGSGANNGKEINNFEYVKRQTKDETIYIDDEVWIGANVIFMPGVRVGRCSIIGAGSFVNKDIEPYSVYAGTPAKKILSLK